jgi:hypothetical protein
MRHQAQFQANKLQSGGKPLLFVDIDGVLSLFGFPSDSRPPGRWLNVDGVLHLISATAAQHLHRLASRFELVWCSGWEEKANEHLLAFLSLTQPLPFLTFAAQEHAPHWKLPAIEAHAGDRPLAWIDDAHDDACRAWARTREARLAPTLLVATEPPAGLTDDHVALLERWAAAFDG